MDIAKNLLTKNLILINLISKGLSQRNQKEVVQEPILKSMNLSVLYH